MVYTHNPSAEVKGLRRDHLHLGYVIKDLSDAVDPTHPLAGKLIPGMDACLSVAVPAISNSFMSIVTSLHKSSSFAIAECWECLM